MTLIELNQILKATGYPVAYSHFKATKNRPIPKPPYIVYLEESSTNVFADNKVYKQVKNVRIELYTLKKDLQAEAKLEALLDENDLPYEADETFIDSEQLFQRIYEVGLI